MLSVLSYPLPVYQRNIPTYFCPSSAAALVRAGRTFLVKRTVCADQGDAVYVVDFLFLFPTLLAVLYDLQLMAERAGG